MQDGVTFRGTESAGYTPPHANDRMTGCTPDAAIFSDWESITVCTDECRAATRPPGAPESANLTVVGGKLVALATHGKVLGIWRQDAPPAFYSLSVPLSLLIPVMTDGNVIDAVGDGGEGVKIIRVPAH
jgi:hypothetical protein